jgi:hypothetical protein
MPSDLTFFEAVGWTLWYVTEVATKWAPGFAVSIAGGQDPSVAAATPPPVITSAVTVQDVVLFLQTSSAPGMYDTIYFYWSILLAVSLVVSLVCGTVLFYCIQRVVQIRRAEYKHFESMAHTVKAHDMPKTHLRWEHILDQARSDTEQNRRLAILEADIMLGELLDELGYRGETMSDKMRKVDRSSFNTIDMAWEAHRARNRIAHEAGHTLIAAEARRIIDLYQRVFREFKFVE